VRYNANGVLGKNGSAWKNLCTIVVMSAPQFDKVMGEGDAMTDPYEEGEKFAATFRQSEHALKRSGYLRKDKDNAEADWDAFAQKLGPAFFDHIVKSGIAITLVGDPPRRQLATMEWVPKHTTPLTNVAQLIVNGVCRVRNSYFHGEKFVGGEPGQFERDATLVTEAHAVLHEAMKTLTNEPANRAR
jgi:hypothetical protein